MSAGIFRVIASFEDAAGKPLAGDEYRVRLYDRDPLIDDALGDSGLDADGRASFIFSSGQVKSIDSPGETKPDLYFVLERDGKEVFRSETLEEIDFRVRDSVTEEQDRTTQSFGPYRVER